MVYARTFLSVLLIISFSKGVLAAQNNFQWQAASPESQGMSAEKLDAMRDTLAAKKTKSLLIIRNDKIIYEWYSPEHSAARRHYTASLAKALVGGMSLTLALNDGLLAADDPACKYIPEWKDHPQRSKITIRHLATHSSGIENAEISEQDRAKARAEKRTLTDHHMSLPGWKGAFWRKEPDPFTISRDQAPVIFAPGSKYDYSNPGMAMLAYAVTAGLKNTPHTDIRTLLRQRIMKPIGIADDQWSIGYGKTYEVNGLPIVANWGGGEFTARAIARVGRLMLRKGNWQGKQLIDSAWVKEVIKYAGTPKPNRPSGNPNPASGLGWYTNFDGVWPKVPRDAFAGAGAGNQVLLVVPSLDLIIVRNGANLYDESKGEGFWGGPEKYLFNPIMESITAQPRVKKAAGQSSRNFRWPKDMRGMNVICKWIDESDGEHLARNWKANSVRIWAREPMETLEADVKLLRKHGLYVIICHQPDNWRRNLNEFWNSKEQQKKYIDWWVQVAELFKDSGDGVAYDLMNEPHDSSMHVWNSLYPEIAKAIRRVDKVHPIVLEPPGWGWPYGFKDEHGFKPIDDDNTVYSFHMYDPMDLTHVRKEGMRYPGNVDGLYWNKETIRSKLEPVLDYARKHNVTLWCGEVGCTRWAYGAKEYLKDCIDIFEEEGIGWSVYSYREWWNNMDYEKNPSDKAQDCPRTETEIVKMFKKYFSLNPPIKAAGGAPYPMSDIRTKFAPASSIVRKAEGSDNWPLTWADDDNQYTAYGDGWGFEPKVEKKLSMGIVKIVGSPADFKGVNIRTQSGERTGDGAGGPKASGMLMVDGVLYMLVRNTDNSQLAWSKDYGRTWTWSDWKFTTSFGYPTFLNFGKNYAGARDGYVYIYSNDNDSAYVAADEMVLARVPKDRITERGAYEFFKGLGADGQAVWTKDVAQREGVFEHKGRCYRSGISYNAGLGRYLWCQVHPESVDSRGPRFEGGFGIYESAEPWGPWRTVFFTEKWDVGPGETSSLPVKWMSNDGKTCHLVFSGDDHFSVRKVTFAVEADYFPQPESTGGWRKNTDPAFISSVGIDPNKLKEFGQYNLSVPNSNWMPYAKYKGIIIIKNGWVVGEWYNIPEAKTFKTYISSNGKAFAMVGFGILADDSQTEKINIKINASSSVYDRRWLPQGFPLSDPLKKHITFEQIFRHTSGLCPERNAAGENVEKGRNEWTNYVDWLVGHDEKWPQTKKLYFKPGHPKEYEGKEFAYSSVSFGHLGLVFKNIYGMPASDFLSNRLLNHIGFSGIDYHAPPSKEVKWFSAGGLRMTPRDYARFAYFLLRSGKWNNKQIVPPSWLQRFTTSPHYPNIRSNIDGHFGAQYPKDMFRIAGSGLNWAFIIPSLDLIALRTGRADNKIWDKVEKQFLEKLFAAVKVVDGR